jgi:hypothetical protein
MEGKPERVNVLVVEEVRDKGERIAVNEEEEEEEEEEGEVIERTKTELEDALSREEALGFAEFQQTRGKTDDRLTRGCIEKAGSSPGPASELNEGFVFPH